MRSRTPRRSGRWSSWNRCCVHARGSMKRWPGRRLMIETTAAALEAARRVLRLESRAVASLEARLDDGAFARAVTLLVDCRGRVLTSGVGKSGLVAARLAATLT